MMIENTELLTYTTILYTIANSVMLGCSEYLSILSFYAHEEMTTDTRIELNQLYL